MTFDVDLSFNRHFNDALLEEMASCGIPFNDWFHAGPRSPDEHAVWWRAEGPAIAQKYIDWYESQPGRLDVWITPDGRPAIELDLTVQFGDIPVKVIIDQVLRSGNALLVLDLKSGAQVPESMAQLGIAASALELTYGIRPRYGSFFMHRQDPPFLTPSVLDGYQYSVKFFTQQFALLDKAVRSGIFIAKPGKQCKRCGVAQACPAMGVRPE